MTTFKARVRNGRLVLDVPTDLPEGSEVELVPTTIDDDQLTDAERAALDAAIARGLADGEAGRVHDVEDVLRGLHKQP